MFSEFLPKEGLPTLHLSLQQTLQAPSLVREPGFEPGTYRLGGGCSIQLSYKRDMLRSLGPGAYYRDMRPL